jgi:hypothetical protein
MFDLDGWQATPCPAIAGIVAMRAEAEQSDPGYTDCHLLRSGESTVRSKQSRTFLASVTGTSTVAAFAGALGRW